MTDLCYCSFKAFFYVVVQMYQVMSLPQRLCLAYNFRTHLKSSAVKLQYAYDISRWNTK